MSCWSPVPSLQFQNPTKSENQGFLGSYLVIKPDFILIHLVESPDLKVVTCNLYLSYLV